MINSKMIGNKIAEARKKINISQAELAERMFISPQAVGKWERGESMPDIITFNRLTEILGVDLNYFSDTLQSGATETETNGSSNKASTELPYTEKEKKPDWDMSRGNWVDADFSGLKNLHEKFSSSNMQSCKFISSDLSGLLLKSNNIENCDFSGSDLSNCHVQRSNLSSNQFNRCTMQKAEFSGSFISGCDFSGADFTEVSVKSGGFEKCTVVSAVWNRTSFISIEIADIEFDGRLEDCYFENCFFKKVTFRNATLINTFFKNNKLKGIRFVNCKADRMTYEFLKIGKADLNGISLITKNGGNE